MLNKLFFSDFLLGVIFNTLFKSFNLKIANFCPYRNASLQQIIELKSPLDNGMYESADTYVSSCSSFSLTDKPIRPSNLIGIPDVIKTALFDR